VQKVTYADGTYDGIVCVIFILIISAISISHFLHSVCKASVVVFIVLYNTSNVNMQTKKATQMSSL